MFTGLIEEVGKIVSIRNIGGGRSIVFNASKILDDLNIDDSVSINGVCQTVVSIAGAHIEVEAVEETLRKSTMGSFRPGQQINLERAVRPADRLGGHFVQGHVDCKGKVSSIHPEQTGILLWIEYPPEFGKYLVNSGSICINGVSLTSARVEKGRFMCSIIPHTWKVTTLAELKPGTEVNLEFDVLGKYVEKLLTSRNKEPGNNILSQFIDQPDY